MHDRLQRLGKPGRESRLAVPAQGHVPQLEQIIRQRAVMWPLAQTAAAHQGQRRLQFRGHGLNVQQLLGLRPLAVHLAIDALEVAGLVGAQIDAYRQAAGARGHHRVHETVVQKITWGAEGGLLAAIGPIREFPLPFRRFNRGYGLMNGFFHNV